MGQTMNDQEIIDMCSEARALLVANGFLFVMKKVDWKKVSQNVDQARHRLDKVALIFAKEREAGRLK